MGRADLTAARAAGLPARAAAILALLKEHRQLGSAEILRRLGEPVTQRALSGELRRLQDAGLIVAVGKGRATTYEIAEEQ